MPTKTKKASRPAALPFAAEAPVGAWPAPPASAEERLERIRALQERINSHVEFVCRGDTAGTSAEAKDRTLAALYEQLLAAERRLGRIQEELRLG